MERPGRNSGRRQLRLGADRFDRHAEGWIALSDYAAASGNTAQFASFSLTTVPEPGAMVLLATGLIGLLAYRVAQAEAVVETLDAGWWTRG